MEIIIELIEAVYPVLLNVITAGFVSAGGYIAFLVINLLRDTLIRKIVETGANMVEKIGRDLGSEEKKAMAVAYVVDRLNRWKIPAKVEDVDAMIEAFVLSFKKHYKEEVDKLEAVGTE